MSITKPNLEKHLTAFTVYTSVTIVTGGKWLRNLAKFFGACFYWLFWGLTYPKLGKIQKVVVGDNITKQ